MSRSRTVAEGWVPLRHGIPSSYVRGCRCDECRAAQAARQRSAGGGGYGEAHRRRNFAERTFVGGRWIAPVPDERHGREDTYKRHGCRCVRCTVATREATAARKAKR